MTAFDRAWAFTKFDVHFAPKHRGHHTLASDIEERGHEYPSTHYFDNIDEESPGSVRHTDEGTHFSGQSTPRLQDDGSYVGVNLTNQDFTDDSKWDEDVESLSRIGAHETVHQMIEPEIEEWADEESGYGSWKNRDTSDLDDGDRIDNLFEGMDRGENKKALRSLGHEFGAFSSTPDSSQPSGFMSAEERKERMSGRSYGKIREYVKGNKPFSDLRPKSEPLDAFDRAWGVVKAPWIDGGSTHVPSGKPVTIDGPLYSGGDILDEPRYWTDDVSEALAYAMFGSAVPRSEEEIIHGLKNFKNKVKMRETVPQIMVAPDPGDAWRGKDGHIDVSLLDENDDIQNYILYDDQPHSEAWLADDQWGAPEHAPMPRDELEAMIQRIVDSGDDHFRWGNTGTYMSQEARRAHILGALERLQTNTRGQTNLPDDAKRFVHTSETDQIHDYDDEDYLREWGRWEE